MIETTGDLFELFDGGKYDAIVIPVNTTIDTRGDLVMGAGVAKAAKERWPWLPTAAASRTDYSVYTFREPGTNRFIVHFQTKRHWRHPSTIEMVRKSAATLKRWADKHHDEVNNVIMPRVGCGHGGLAWIDVQRILSLLLDSRFHVTEGPK